MSKPLRHLLAPLVAASTTVAMGIATVPPAAAAVSPTDAGRVAEIAAFFDDLATQVLPDVASGSALAQQLPTIAVTPAGSVDLRSAFGDLLTTGPLKDLATQASLSAAATYVGNADADGWELTAGSTADSLTVGFTRTLTETAGLDIRNEDGTLSLSTGDGIDVTGTMTGSFTFVYDEVSGLVSLTSPSLSIATTASLSDDAVLDAGLGILGVSVAGGEDGTAYDLSTRVSTAWSNPDDDPDGRLAFDNPATAAPADGELSAAGAGAGLVTPTRTAGSVQARLVAVPRRRGVVDGLPAAGGTVTVSSTAPGAGFEVPAVTAQVDPAAEPFLTMTPRDLAAGLSQAASAVLALQNAEDGQLPLMRGSVANAVDAVGGIKQFLAAQVPDADPDDDTPGQPLFASLQDMLAALDAAAYGGTGWSLDVLDGDAKPAYVGSDRRVDFTLRADRSVAAPIELNILGAATTGVGTYTAAGLSATGVDFRTEADPTGATLVNRRVDAGTSWGIVTAVTGDRSLTVDTWNGGTPAASTPFSVEAADPKTGAPTFADSLQGTVGIEAANADLSRATITPDVTVTLPMSLDLSAPLTYAGDSSRLDCDPGPGEADCPFQQIDQGSGLARIISSLPLPADRVLLRQSPGLPVLDAGAEITSPVSVDAQAGYVAVALSGTVAMDAEDLQTITLRGSGTIPLPTFVENVRRQSIAADGAAPAYATQLAGTVTADLDVSIPGAPDAFGAGDGDTSLALSGDVADLGDGIDAGEVSVSPATPAQAALLKAVDVVPGNPAVLFAGVQSALDAVGTRLTSLGAGGLDQPVPLLGSSLGDVLAAGAAGGAGVTYAPRPASGDTPATTTLTDPGAAFGPAYVGRQIVVGSTTATIVDASGTTLTLAPQLPATPSDGTSYLVENELLGAVHLLRATTPGTLQEALSLAEASLGHGSSIDLGLVQQAGSPHLRLDVDWNRSYTVSRPLSLTFGSDQQLVGTSASGSLRLAAGGDVALRLLVPLDDDALASTTGGALLDAAGTSIDLGVDVAASDLVLDATLGPVTVGLGSRGRPDADPVVPADPGSVAAGLDVSVSGASGVTSVGDWFDPADLSVDAAASGAGGVCEADELLCATFPVYVGGARVGGPGEALTISTTEGSSGLADALGTGTTVTLPAGLEALLAGEPFDISALTGGLGQYLGYAQSALGVASNNGEMPIIGKDLQAGADFLGQARTQVDALLGDADPTTVGGLRDLLTTKLADELGVVVNGAQGVQFGFTCTNLDTTVEMTAPTNVTATATNGRPVATGSATKQYRYQVVATYGTSQSTPSAYAPATDAGIVNAATLDAAHYNVVRWDQVLVAKRYTIVRSERAGSTATWSAPVVVGTKSQLSPATFRDRGTTSTTPLPAYTPATANPQVPAGADCDDDTLLTQVEGVTLGLSLGQGDISREDGCTDSAEKGECLAGELPIDLGLPGLSLQTGDGGAVRGAVGWALDLGIGLSRSRGFYVNTEDEDEFEVGASLGITRTGTERDLSAQLAILEVNAKKLADTPEFVGHFGIDITDDDGFLTLAEIASAKISDTVKVSVGAKVDVNWALRATADSALPGISTNFRLQWGWGAATGQGPGVPASNTSGLSVRFDEVRIDTGEFFGKALKPYLQQVLDATKPMQPIIDTLFTPMPVISDLSTAAGGQEITLATLAKTFSTLRGGPNIEPFLEAVRTVRRVVGSIGCSGGTDVCAVTIGSFDLSPQKVATTTSNAGNAGAMIATKTPQQGATGALYGKSSALSNGASRAPVGLRNPGFSVPIINDPTLLFTLIAGGDIPLLEFDSGPLELGFSFQKSFGPIYAPPPVMMVIGGGASVSLRVAAGFDTFGIRQAIETGDGAQVLDSLYFKTVDAAGKPIPVVQFSGYLEAGASVSLAVIEVGVVGGIKLTVGFYWNDPTNDGKFRLFEFASAALQNPICLFNIGGELSLYIKVFVKLGIDPFSVKFDFQLVNIKLLDFSLKPDCTPPPPKLAGTADGALYVFVGAQGGTAQRGHPVWAAGERAETWVVRQVPAYTQDGATVPAALEVRGLGITESFPSAGISTVVVDGRGAQGRLSVTFTGGSAPVEGAAAIPFSKNAIVFGGPADDTIRTGVGDSWVDGGGGADVITTLDRTDLATPLGSGTAIVAGGPGSDVISVGNGNDTVTGDGSLTATTHSPTVARTSGSATLGGVVRPGGVAAPGNLGASSIATGADGDDQISAGLGAVTLSGNGGDDVIGTADDSPLARTSAIRGTPSESLYRAHASTLIGGDGQDVLKSGSADDTLYTGGRGATGENGAGAGDLATDVNTVDTGTGSDTVHGAQGQDFVTTGSSAGQKATVYGGGSSDVLTGGLGADELFGGPGDDYVIASPAAVGAPGSTSDQLGLARTVEVQPGAGAQPKVLGGGTGSDRLYGSDGPSTLFGDTRADACQVQTAPVSRQPGETPNTDDRADLVLGGQGVDVVAAGGGADWVYAAGGDDRLCGNAGADRMFAGDGADLAYGGSDADQLHGESGDDRLYGNTGQDAVYGGDGADRLQGNEAADWLDGGSDDDVIVGGTTAAGIADGGDWLLGAGGADVLVGDNATSDVRGDRPYPLDLGSTVASVGGDDVLLAGDQDDLAYGGLGADQIAAGEGDDVVEGNPGQDRLSGQAGDDDLIGGSSQLASGTENGRPDAADVIGGGDGQDVIAGDNATITRTGTAHPATLGRGLRVVRAVDLADESAGSPTGVSGDDTIDAGPDTDVVFGQRGGDTVVAGDGANYAEGGPDGDTLTGGAGDDDLVGGSFTPVSGSGVGATGQPDGTDTVSGGGGQDLVLGDNGSALRGVATAGPLSQGRLAAPRGIAAYDLGPAPIAGTSARDLLLGGDGLDLLLGQGGDDDLAAGEGDDYAEGGQGRDRVLGDDGHDDLVGGSWFVRSGTGESRVGQPDGTDDVQGGPGQDVALGDNGAVLRTGTSPLVTGRGMAQRGIAAYDLGAPVTGTSAADTVTGGDDTDVLLGQGGDDAVDGGGEADYAEGGQGADLVVGGVGNDDLVGGSSSLSGTAGQPDAADDLVAGLGDDAVLGDNGLLTRVAAADGSWDRRTVRSSVAVPGTAASRIPGRSITLHDLVGAGRSATAGRSGGDTIAGQGGVDVLLGQDGDDQISGGGHDDYAEGDGGADRIDGDGATAQRAVPVPNGATWTLPGETTPAAGQDDLLGGWTLPGFRDGADTLLGGGASDFVLGDNGTAVRVVDGSVDRAYDARYAPASSGERAKVRVAATGTSTRFCAPAAGQTTCEAAGAFGGDTLVGGDGDDFLHGQDGDDQIIAGAGDDDAYGELGADTIDGGEGEDAVLGDRGGIRDRYEDGSRARTTSLTQPPAISFTSRRAGTVSREVDLAHEVNGAGFTAGPLAARIPLDGLSAGGPDVIRGGPGRDSLHGGVGDDLVNGEGGGDAVFGDRGDDALWGGLGREGCTVGDTACLADRGPGDAYVDHVLGGEGADVLDWRPRGSLTTRGVTCSADGTPLTTDSGRGRGATTTTVDPCRWIEVAGTQHHQGIDWIYGGWDRDVLQADNAANGPNDGDRLIDWNGAYNLYSHCNAAYGGFNDVRQHSPAMQAFLQAWAYGLGAGQEPADTSQAGTSAYEELRLTYVADGRDHGSGSAFPGTPGHYDANACS